MFHSWVLVPLAMAALGACLGTSDAQTVRYGDWHQDAPGVVHRILPADLPADYATQSHSNGPHIVARPPGASPVVPAGFTAALFASGLRMPRGIRVAPNGDIFVAESGADRVRLLRAPDGAARPVQSTVFATGLNMPFGMAFFPPGPDPRWVYVAETDKLVRFAYRNGDVQAEGRPEVVIPTLPEGGHWTRDLAVAPDGSRLYLSVGSASNVATGLAPRDTATTKAWEATHGRGAGWGDEAGRADVLVLDPEGHDVRVFATGLRNCSGETIQPATGDLWCATNERDGLGDDLPPDYITRVRSGAFYGWPWYYIGDHEDPRHRGERPDLRGGVTVPDLLLQPHSAPLGMVFYDGAMFPRAYRGDAFVALHGSWNRGLRTGYKVVRVHMEAGQPTGGYEDFMTGFVADEEGVWGRPVDVAVAHDGALLVTEDGNDTIWRIAYRAD